jgi:hypothetical protein
MRSRILFISGAMKTPKTFRMCDPAADAHPREIAAGGACQLRNRRNSTSSDGSRSSRRQLGGCAHWPRSHAEVQVIVTDPKPTPLSGPRFSIWAPTTLVANRLRTRVPHLITLLLPMERAAAL